MSKPLGKLIYKQVEKNLVMHEKSSEFLSYNPLKAILTATFGSFEIVKEYFGENKITLTLSDKEGASREY